MAVDGIPIKEFWAFFTWLPKFILRWRFTPEKLAGLVHVDLRPRGDATTLNLGEVASFELWLQVINLSPFEIVLDRADFNFRCGPVLQARYTRRQKIAPGEIAALRLAGSMTDGEVRQVVQHNKNNNSISLDGHIDFDCALHPFAKPIGYLEGIKPTLQNLGAR